MDPGREAGGRPYRAILVAGLLAAVVATVLVAAVAAALVPPAPRPAVVHADHPPLGFTGGFGEPTCHACHFDHDLNALGGSLALDGLPIRYGDGEAYSLTVRLDRDTMARGGFMLSARMRTGEQAGTLEAASTGTAVSVSESTGVMYAHHTLEGSRIRVPGTAFWTLRWRAPSAASSAADTIFFHIAANASNDDESAFGDVIYALEVGLPATD